MNLLRGECQSSQCLGEVEEGAMGMDCRLSPL